MNRMPTSARRFFGTNLALSAMLVTVVILASCAEAHASQPIKRAEYIAANGTPLLDLDATLALLFIHRAQLSRAAYLAILQRGLDDADASSIRHWMPATVAHLGWRKVFSVLRQELTVKPRRVAMALYHVPYLYFPNQKPLPTTALLDEFCQLVELCHRKGYVACPDAKAFQLIRERALRTTRSP